MNHHTAILYLQYNELQHETHLMLPNSAKAGQYYFYFMGSATKL